MILNLALSYGSRAEITSAFKSLATDVQARRIQLDDVNEQMISDRLFTAGMPDPDLLIRTSGELRLSNFLLWQCAYAEIYVSDLPWPDFRRPQLEAAFESFGGRERRFGQTGQQLRDNKQ